MARWYRSERFSRVSVTPGMIRGRKLLSIAGWTKHGVLWECTDLSDGDYSFEHRFDTAARDDDWTGRHVLEYVTHGYGSPNAGRLIWPKRKADKRQKGGLDATHGNGDRCGWLHR